MAEQDKLARQIEKRKREMDKRNRKMDKINNRTTNAKQMIFQTPDSQKFMIMNASTLEKLDAPSDSVIDFVMAQRNRVPR